ncbi:MAG TPA: WD40 repeat domain-containing protein [Anaerolineaceae bacterium]
MPRPYLSLTSRAFILVILAGLFLVVVSACGSKTTFKPSPTFPSLTLPAVLQTNPLQAIFPPTPQPSRSITRTPVRSKDAIVPGNVAQLSEIARWSNGAILNMAASPDGKVIAFATRRGVALYDAASFQEIRLIEIAGGIPKVAFSTDLKILAAADWNSKITLYRVQDGAQVMTLDGGEIGQPLSMVFSEDGKTLNLGTTGELNLLWDTSTGKLARRWYTSGASAMSASSDGYFLVTSNYQGNIFVWTAADGHNQGRLWRDSDVECLQFGPDSHLVAACYGDFAIGLWDAMDGKLLFTLHGHTNRVVGAAFSPDGKILASASWDQSVRLWDTTIGKEIRTLAGSGGRILQVLFSGDGKSVISLAEDGIVRVWRASDGKLVQSISDFVPLGRAIFSLDSKQVATGGDDGAWRVWRVADGKLLRSVMAHPGGISDLRFTPDGLSLVTGGIDKTIRLWNVADGTLLAELTGSEGWIDSLDISPDGGLVAGSTTSSIVRLWSLPDGRLKISINTGFDTVLKVLFAPDGESLWTGGLDGSLKQWSVSDGSLIATYKESGPFISSLSFPEDGEWLAAAGDDRRINLWELTGKGLVLVIDGIKNEGVSSLTFSPDGQILIAGFWDKTLRIYSVPNGELLKQWDFPFVVRVVNITPDSALLALSLDDGTVRIWGVK